MKDRNSDHNNDGGFTLIELLTVLVITGILMIIIVDGFRNIRQIWFKATSQNDITDQSEALHQFIDNLLSQAFPEFRRDVNGNQRIMFWGEAHDILFLAPSPDSFEVTDIIAYRLHVSSMGRLTLSWQFDRPSGGVNFGSHEWTEMPLADNLQHATFSYFGAIQSNSIPKWYTEWQRGDALPSLINVHLRDDGDIEGRDIFIRPLITANYCKNSGQAPCSF